MFHLDFLLEFDSGGHANDDISTHSDFCTSSHSLLLDICKVYIHCFPLRINDELDHQCTLHRLHQDEALRNQIARSYSGIEVVIDDVIGVFVEFDVLEIDAGAVVVDDDGVVVVVVAAVAAVAVFEVGWSVLGYSEG